MAVARLAVSNRPGSRSASHRYTSGRSAAAHVATPPAAGRLAPARTTRTRLLDDAHQQLGGPLVVVWDGLNTHVSHAMADLAGARDWLTVFRLPPYAHELNPVESVWTYSLPSCRVSQHDNSGCAGDPGDIARSCDL